MLERLDLRGEGTRKLVEGLPEALKAKLILVAKEKPALLIVPFPLLFRVSR